MNRGWTIFFIILAVLTIGIIIMCITSQVHIGCTEGNFGCTKGSCENCGCEGCDQESPKGCALFCGDQKGIRCESTCLDCEWFPFFFGCATGGTDYYDNYASPVICGFDVCAFGTIDTYSNISETKSTYLPIATIETSIEEGRDYTIEMVTYILQDRHGIQHSFSSFDDLLNSDQYKTIQKECLNLDALDDYWTFSFAVVYDIYVAIEEETDITASVVLSSSMYDSIINNPDRTKHSSTIKASKGNHTITVSCESLDYVKANPLYHYKLEEPIFTGTITTYTLGE